MGMITELMLGTVSELTPAQVVFLQASIDRFKPADWKVEIAGQAASTRRFFRIFRKDGSIPKSYILVEWDSKDEDWPRFLGIADYVLPSTDILPKIYANDPAHGLILEEDLGAVTLKHFCQNEEMPSIEAMYRQTIDALFAWHRIDVSNCQHITSRTMDVETFLWETDYFARHCVTEFFAKEKLLSASWKRECRQMAEHAASLPKVNMHRDFQSENILIRDGRIRFVDYQGTRPGPPHYDVASLLCDPYITRLDDKLVDSLRDYYFIRHDTSPFMETDYYICAAQRLMQALGAYTNLSLHRGKPHYRQYVPIALERLSRVFNEHLPGYPAMGEAANVCLQCQ